MSSYFQVVLFEFTLPNVLVPIGVLTTVSVDFYAC